MKKLYLVSGRPLARAGRHPWFGSSKVGGYRGYANYVETTNFRHALAQYKRLPVANRQMDLRCNRKATVLLYGRSTRLQSLAE